MIENDTFTTRIWGCVTCHGERRHLSWNYDPAPVCCDQPMTLGTSNGTIQIITDDVPGGFVVENGFTNPRKFYSKSEHRKALAENGCRIADRGEVRCR
jgi:hypothetical protein